MTAPRYAAVAMGTFDGVHRGHRLLIARLAALARRRQMRSVIVALERPVRHVTGLLTTRDEKIALLQHGGVDEVVILPVDQALTAQTADEFFANIICGELQARHLVVGQNFAFGRGRAGDVRWLRIHGPAAGVRCTILRPACYHRQPISSSRIRMLLHHSRVAYANRLLGRFYSFAGMPVPGRQIGRKLGFPTINLQVDASKLLPPGVFAAIAERDGRWYPAVMNIGTRPTFADGGNLLPEVHLLDFSGTWPARQTRIHICEHLRGEHPFSGRDALQQQLARDVDRARAYFLLSSPLYDMR